MRRSEDQKNTSSGYLIVLLNFVLGILAVLVMVVILHQRNEINTLRHELAYQKNELASCSDIKNGCINQLGCFYKNPNNKKGQTYVSNNQ